MIRRELRYGPALVRLGDRTEDRDGKPTKIWFADATMETATGRIRVRAEVDETVVRALYLRAADYSRQAAAMLGFDSPALGAAEVGYEGGWDFFKELDQLGKSQVFKDITRTVDQVIQSPEMRAAMNFLPYGELIRQGVSLGTGAASAATQGGPAAALRATLGRGLGMIPGMAPKAPPALPPRPTYPGSVVSGVARRPLPGPARATARMVARVGRAKAGDPEARASLEEVGRLALRGSVPHQKAAALASAMAGGPALSDEVAGWLEAMAEVYEADGLDAPDDFDDETGAARRRRTRRARRTRARRTR